MRTGGREGSGEGEGEKKVIDKDSPASYSGWVVRGNGTMKCGRKVKKVSHYVQCF